MNCPTCGGPTFDNRAGKASGAKSAKWPDFKCRDASCGWVQWPPREKKAFGKAVGEVRRPKWTWPELAEVYRKSFLLAEQRLVQASKAGPKLGFTMADVLSATATIFICASRDGVEAPVDTGEPGDAA